MIKAIVFDADGVLINAERFSVSLEKEYGIPVDTVLPFFTGIFQQCLVGKADLKTVIGPHLKEWGWQGTADDLLSFWFRSEHKIDEEIIKIVQELSQKTPVFLATNQEKCRTDYMAKEMGFEKIFMKIYSSTEIGHLKTDEKFFEEMTKDIREKFIPDVQPEEILFFDDTLENIDTAKRFGIQAELYEGIDGFKTLIDSLGL